MTPTQIELVRASWKHVAPIQDTAARLFYDRLFELDPSVAPLFKGDMHQQGRRLMTMIGYAVASLSQLDVLLPALRDLGRRHGAYGVTDTHYDTVGSALLWTLDKGLGEAFTAEVSQAWRTAYGVLAQTMREAAAMGAGAPRRVCGAGGD